LYDQIGRADWVAPDGGRQALVDYQALFPRSVAALVPDSDCVPSALRSGKTVNGEGLGAEAMARQVYEWYELAQYAS